MWSINCRSFGPEQLPWLSSQNNYRVYPSASPNYRSSRPWLCHPPLNSYIRAPGCSSTWSSQSPRRARSARWGSVSPAACAGRACRSRCAWHSHQSQQSALISGKLWLTVSAYWLGCCFSRVTTMWWGSLGAWRRLKENSCCCGTTRSLTVRAATQSRCTGTTPSNLPARDGTTAEVLSGPYSPVQARNIGWPVQCD